MTHPRNTTGIKENADRKRQATLAKAEAGIRKLLTENRPVTFEGVAETAGISRAWLYREPELKDRIVALRNQSSPKQSVPTTQRASDASKDAMISALRQQGKKSRQENEDLRHQIEVAYGMAREAQLNGNSEQVQKLNDQITKLKAQNRELKEKLSGYEGLEQEVEILKKQKQALMNEIMMLKAGQPDPSVKTIPKTRTGAKR